MALVDTCTPASKKDRVQEGLIHGASAMRLFIPLGRSDLRVAACGINCRDKFKHGSVASRPGTYNSPMTMPSRPVLPRDNVCILSDRSRESTAVRFDYERLDDHSSCQYLTYFNCPSQIAKSDIRSYRLRVWKGNSRNCGSAYRLQLLRLSDVRTRGTYTLFSKDLAAKSSSASRLSQSNLVGIVVYAMKMLRYLQNKTKTNMYMTGMEM